MDKNCRIRKPCRYYGCNEKQKVSVNYIEKVVV